MFNYFGAKVQKKSHICKYCGIFFTILYVFSFFANTTLFYRQSQGGIIHTVMPDHYMAGTDVFEGGGLSVER